MERISRKAAEARVLDLDGREHPLRSLWARRAAVLLFVRHFGCREQAARLYREKGTIRALGAELVIIGNTVPCFARAFREDLAITTPIYVDPSMASYRLLDIRCLREALLSGGSLKHKLSALYGGFREAQTKRDRSQLGGVLVVRQDGAVVYRHLSESADDHPAIEEVLAALATEIRRIASSGRAARSRRSHARYGRARRRGACARCR